ncbi:MAG TPA: S-adenosylmethionine:tRNA ribosyltransferase-isomerase [Pseudonocardiaceae bacterium]|nr:S-adenosylmethionine:tRNA ribosyltransferase-isomerase [Pseudonocardiaceae bacterium]
MTIAADRPATQFTLPLGSEAAGPPEHRGVPRDGVRLLVARPDRIEHRRFADLPSLLEPGDLVVVNTSATLPAAICGRRHDDRAALVHIATSLGPGEWVVEIRRLDGRGPDLTTHRGQRLYLPGGVALVLSTPYPDAALQEGPSRLWRAAVTPPTPLVKYLSEHGRPIRYGYLADQYPLADYQTVYARQPGSAEMASAGRPFTAPLLVALMASGITVAPVVLHAGVSSPELHEPPAPERFEVPGPTARLVQSACDAGHRVVAVGTTVVRALETATQPSGLIGPARGWTDLVVGPGHPVRIVTGLITGLHPPQASHLLVLEALAGPELVEAAYAAAVQCRYLWHEFGDATLMLPDRHPGTNRLTYRAEPGRS